jgi:arylsulfatase A-like enzyme
MSTHWFAVTRIAAFSPVVLLALTLVGCRKAPEPLTADVPLHLEDHLEAANVIGSGVPADVPAPVEWRFAEPQPDWKPIVPLPSSVRPAKVSRTDDSLRISLTEVNDYELPWSDRPDLVGGIYIELPDWRREEWGDILVRARTSNKVEGLFIGFNLREKIGAGKWERFPFLFGSPDVPVIRDGSEQAYVMRADWSMDYSEQWEGPWRQLGVEIWSHEPVSIDILSVSVIPKEARYTDAPVGVKAEARDQSHRRTLYTHAPAKLEYRVRIPQDGRLDVGLGVLRDDVPVTFRVTAHPEGQAAEHLLQEALADKEKWAQRSLDLSHLAGRTVTLSLEAEADRAGTVALWAAPTLSGSRTTAKPNVIFYIIDGAGADYMSAYGYNRRTTPNIERLAAEGALFERAYTNAGWTRPSNLSFLTSLQHSVMGGMRNNRNAPPEQILTLPEHLHRAAYQTALFTSNPNAATMSNLDRGVDVLREKSVEPTSRSTEELHADFWRWRGEYPGEPYWAHFQTTDVHGPHNPPAPFAGLFVSPERRKILDEWEKKLKATNRRMDPWGDAYDKAGVDRIAYFDGKRGLYAEGMAHQDYQIGRLVERLRAIGEWENTLLIIAADHGAAAGSQDYAIAAMDPLPPQWSRPLLRPGVTRIPMIFVWPGHIAPGQRFRQPVSMIDMLPTILDLVDLPMPEVMQGQSLEPVLLGKPGWEPRPVIFDEFYEDANTGKFLGSIEVIDGRWGASLEINQDPENDERPPRLRRPVPLLVYDLWNDPYCLESLHDERPDLVKKYTEFLEAQFEAHQSLAQQFTRSEDSPLTPEQLRTLRSLGYIQ